VEAAYAATSVAVIQTHSKDGLRLLLPLRDGKRESDENKID
jgi:hypothetical protein